MKMTLKWIPTFLCVLALSLWLSSTGCSPQDEDQGGAQEEEVHEDQGDAHQESGDDHQEGEEHGEHDGGDHQEEEDHGHEHEDGEEHSSAVDSETDRRSDIAKIAA